MLTTCQVSNDTGSCSVRYIENVGNLALDTLSRGGNTLDLLALPECEDQALIIWLNSSLSNQRLEILTGKYLTLRPDDETVKRTSSRRHSGSIACLNILLQLNVDQLGSTACAISVRVIPCGLFLII